MSEQVESYRRILRSSSIIGGASVINILIGVVRTKIVAILLGPTGIGLVSLYAGLMTTATAVATMGIGTIGTRQIAEALSQENQHALAVVRRSMLWGTLLLASAGGLVVWSLREVLAVKVLGSAEHALIVGWLALGVALSVASASQGALIQGMRRIGDMARLSVFGSVLNTLLGLALLWQFGQTGLVAYVLTGPLTSFLLGYWYLSRSPQLNPKPIAIQEMMDQWQTLLRLGIPFMGAGLVAALVQLWIRVEIGTTFGVESIGHFQAASAISMQYIGFVLGAMGADYYPRLTGVMNDHKAATRLVNEQTEIALLLSAPVLIAFTGLAPWIIQLLYSKEFMPAVEILRWQLLGDVLKVASWPLGFVILAGGSGKTFFLSESLILIVMGGIIAIFLSTIGLKITGIAFLAAYAIYLPLIYWLAACNINMRWTFSILSLFLCILLLCIVVLFSSIKFMYFGGCLSVILSLLFASYSFVRLSKMSGLGGPVNQLTGAVHRVAKKFGFKHD